MLRSFILKNASAEHLENWLYDWGHRRKRLFVARNRDKGCDHHGAPWDSGWFVDLQVLPLSPEHCELHLEWPESDSERNRQKATEYAERIVGALSARWKVDEITPPVGQPPVLPDKARQSGKVGRRTRLEVLGSNPTLRHQLEKARQQFNQGKLSLAGVAQAINKGCNSGTGHMWLEALHELEKKDGSAS